MSNLQRSCLLLLVMTFSVLAAQMPSSSADDQAVRDVVAQYMKARNEKNAEAARRLFTPDADQLVSTGEWRKGIDSMIRGMMASSHKELGRSSITVEDVRFIEPDVAIVDGRYQTTSVNGAIRNMWTTLILKRTGGEWRIAAIRNMLPSPPAAAH